MRNSFFTFRINDEERRLIASLADQLQRSKSDAVRFIVVNVVRELIAQEQSNSIMIPKAVNDEN